MNLMFAFFSPGPGEMLLILGVALLLFGGRLPEVARTWGHTLAEFRKGLSGLQNDINEVIYHEPDRSQSRDSLPYYGGDSEVEGAEDGDPYSCAEPEDPDAPRSDSPPPEA